MTNINVADLHSKLSNQDLRGTLIANLKVVHTSTLAELSEKVRFYLESLHALNEQFTSSVYSGEFPRLQKEYRVLARELRRTMVLLENVDKMADYWRFSSHISDVCRYRGGLASQSTAEGILATKLINILEGK